MLNHCALVFLIIYKSPQFTHLQNTNKNMTFPSVLLLAFMSALMVSNLSLCAAQTINLGECDEFAVMAGSSNVCSGTAECNALNGYLGVSPGTSISGPWHTAGGHAARQVTSAKSKACAKSGLAAWKQGASLQAEKLASGALGGKTFTHGVYRFTGAMSISSESSKVYLDAKGNANAKFIFHATTTLITAANSQIVLRNGARAENVYWVLGTAATLGSHSVLQGTVLAGSAISIGTGAKIYGRAIAQTAVTCATACSVVSF
jgi:hypothetical protein